MAAFKPCDASELKFGVSLSFLEIQSKYVYCICFASQSDSVSSPKRSVDIFDMLSHSDPAALVYVQVYETRSSKIVNLHVFGIWLVCVFGWRTTTRHISSS